MTRNTSIFFYALLSVVLSANLYSQNAPIIQWDKTYGGDKYESLRYWKKTHDGGFILGGTSQSGLTGDKSQANQSANTTTFPNDYWIVKMDANGNKKWDKTFGGDGNDILYSINPTFDGGYIIGGVSNSSVSGNKTVINWSTAFNYDLWIIKIDSLGAIQWQKTIGAVNSIIFPSGSGYGGGCVIESKNGGYMVGTNIIQLGTLPDGNLTQTGYGSNDFWIVKLSPTGNVQWDKLYGGSDGDLLTDIKQSSDGSYYLSGMTYSDSSGVKKSKMHTGILGCSVVTDLWVVKVDENGNYLWDASLDSGDNGSDGMDGDALRYATVDTTADGGCFVGGSSNNYCSPTDWVSGGANNDYFVSKLSKDGVVEWNKTFGGIGQEALLSVQQTLDGGYLVGGTSENSGISGNKTINNVGECYWVIKTDSDGNEEWQKVVNAFHDDMCYAYQVSDCCYMFAGISSASIQGDKTENSRGNHDYWAVYLCDTTLTVDFAFDTVCVGDTTHFQAIMPSCLSISEWTFDDVNSGTNNTSDALNPSHKYESESKTYNVSLTVTNGISNKTIMKPVLFKDCEASIEVPNIFTPNGDGSNDIFTIKRSGIKELTCDIYNRWGTIIYRFDLDGSWDGKSNSGEVCLDGVYFYVLSAASNDGVKIEKSGFCTLIR